MAEVLTSNHLNQSFYFNISSFRLFSFVSVVVGGTILVQWYIRRPRARPPDCRCISCVTTCTEIATFDNAGFHHREGNKLHYESLGPSMPNMKVEKGTVILLHGLLSAGRSWVPMAEALVDEGYSCYMPDLLGFGRSPWPRIEYNVESHCEYLVATVKEITKQNKQPVHIIGHSMGALLAYELESSLRNKLTSDEKIIVRSISLFSTPFYNEEGQACKSVGLTPKGLFVRFMINFPAASCLLCSVICQQRWFWVPVTNGFWGFLSFFGVHHDITVSHQIEDFTLHSYHSCAGSFETINRHRMQCHDRVLPPVLLVHGAKDDIVPVERSRAFETALKGASHYVELKELDQSDHALITHPAQINETINILRDFLHRHS